MIPIIRNVGIGLMARIVLCLSIVAVLFFSFGCSKSGESTSTSLDKIEVRVETSGAETISSSKDLEVMLKVSPADTDFTYANGSYNVRMSWNYKAPDMVYREAHWFDRVSSPAGGGDKQGAFKIHGGANWGDPSWRPVQHAIDPAAPNANFGVTSNSGGDPKWVLNEGSDGDYRLELYNADMRINFVKLN